MAHHDVPGEEFYRASLERARALPPAERSADVAAWLLCHDAMEAAAAALPGLPMDGSVLSRPLGGRAALAALMQWLVHSFAALPVDPQHACSTLWRSTPQLPPLMRVWTQGPQVKLRPQPALLSLLGGGHSGCQAGGQLDLETVVRALLLVLVAQWPLINQARVAADVLAALKPALLGEVAAERLDRQIAQLQQLLAGSGGSGSGGDGSGSGAGEDGSSGGSASGTSSSSSEPKLPSARQLQVVWHVMSLLLSETPEAPAVMSPRAVSDMAVHAARGLLQLEPDNPRSSCSMGKVALMNDSLNPASALRDPLPHFLRCVELARQQRNDFLLARGGWWAVMVAASDCNPLLSPTQAAGMMEEAAAAFQRCKRVFPPGWATMLRADRESCAPFHAVVTAHLAASPQRWQHGIRAQQMAGVRQGLRQVIDRNPEGQPLTCDGCGRPSAALKCCSRCKARRYCSTACQAQDWKHGGHKQQCPELAAARAAAAGGGNA